MTSTMQDYIEELLEAAELEFFSEYDDMPCGSGDLSDSESIAF